MAPYKNLKTYQRRDRNVTSISSKSVEVINDLFAKNISKRIATKKSPLKIEELPPRTENYAQTSDSIQVSAEDTFDKLIAGPKYNAVKITDSFRKIATTSESDASAVQAKSLHVTRKTHKPILKRQRRKPKCKVTEVEDSPPESSPSPPFTPLVIESGFPELSVEPAVKHAGFLQESLEESKDDDMVFTESFRRRLARKASVLSSTPVVHAARKNIISNAISPIEKVTCIEKSYDEIKKWDSIYPQIERSKPTSSGKRKGAKPVVKRRKSKSGCKYSDWKLNSQPKVYLSRFKQANKVLTDTNLENKVVDKVQEVDMEHSCEDNMKHPHEDGTKHPHGDDHVDHSYVDDVQLSHKNDDIDEIDGGEHVSEHPHMDDDLDHSHKSDYVLDHPCKDYDTNHSVSDCVEHCHETDHSYALQPGTPAMSPEPIENQTPHVPIQIKHESDSEEDELEESIISLDDSWMAHNMLPKNVTKRRQRKQSFDLVDENVEIETVPVYGREDSPETSAIIVEEIEKEEEQQQQQQRTPVKLSDPRVEERTRQFMDIFHDHSYSASPVPVTAPPPKEVAKKKPEKKNNSKTKPNAAKGKKPKEVPRAIKPKATGEPPDTIALSSMYESSALDAVLELDEEDIEERQRKTLTLAPGKKYRRSLAQVVAKNRCTGDEDCICQNCAKKYNRMSHYHPKLTTVKIVPAPTNDLLRRSVLQVYAASYAIKEEPDRTADLEDSVRSLSLINSSDSCILVGDATKYDPENLTARDIILQRCGQREPLPFGECYPSSLLVNCHKIGEGVYGEVFLYQNPKGGTTVMKVIPIEGSQIINGEHQKKFSDILSEVVITMELSNLRKTGRNSTTCFCEVQKIRCVQGRYPDRLIELWDIYDENRGSENDSPLTFNSQQLYIVLELVNGGSDLEAFSFNNALQAYSMFRQLATTLAVAEAQLKFEHRDLHWGNVLINDVDKNKVIDFCVNGEDVQFISYGVEVCVIDFTLSRIEHDGVVIYLDLSRDDELFMAKGDYQFEIYRLMRQNNEDEWERFEPFSNVLWLHYILDKCIGHLRYKNTKSKTHKDFMEKLKTLKETILKHKSAHSFVTETLMRKK